MNRLHILALVSVCLLAALSAQAADWPHFGGQFGLFFSAEKGFNKDWAAKEPAVLWRVPLTDDGYSGVSAANGKAYIVDHQGGQDIVRCLNLVDGKELWRQVYDDKNGANFGFARATPTVDNGKVYTVSYLGQLTCWDAKTGDKVWGKSLVRDLGGRVPGWGFACSPLIDGDRLVVNPGGDNAAVAVLNKNTGEVIWKGGGSDNHGYSSPVKATILGKVQYVMFGATQLTGVDVTDGSVLWRYDWPTNCGVNAALPIIGKNFIFITSGYGKGCAMVEITAEGPKTTWQNKAMESHFTTPIAAGGFIYGKADYNGPGNFVCLDASNGKLVWSKDGFNKGGFLLADGVFLIVSGGNSEVAMVEMNPKEYKELGRIHPATGESWTAPILVDGKLLVRSKNGLACVDLK